MRTLKHPDLHIYAVPEKVEIVRGYRVECVECHLGLGAAASQVEAMEVIEAHATEAHSQSP